MAPDAPQPGRHTGTGPDDPTTHPGTSPEGTQRSSTGGSAPQAERTGRAEHVPALLAALQASDPGRPRVTWYGSGGERVELSARVLANWVAKSAAMLVQECDVEPGAGLRLALPPHWRTVVLALAGWSVGADVVWDDEEDPYADDLDDVPDPDVLVTTAGGPLGPAGRLVAVDLPALSRSVPDLPAGALDYNAEVTGFDDVLDVEDDAPDRGVIGLARSLATISELAPGDRLLGRAQDVAPDLVLGALLLDGSVVLVSADAGVDVGSVAEQEQVSARA